MSLNYTKSTLKKLEVLFEEAKYRVRYERGNFKAGYCIVNNSSMILINKFFDTKARIGCLLDILHQIEVQEEGLSDDSQNMLQKVLNMNILAGKMVA